MAKIALILVCGLVARAQTLEFFVVPQVSHADRELLRLMDVTAKAVKLPVRGMNVERVGSTDSEPFREKKIPAITIHSLTQETLPVLHSSKDRIEAIHKDEYYRTYRLVLAYLALLDQSLN